LADYIQRVKFAGDYAPGSQNNANRSSRGRKWSGPIVPGEKKGTWRLPGQDKDLTLQEALAAAGLETRGAEAVVPPQPELFTLTEAIKAFGEDFIGIVEIGPGGARVTAGTYNLHTDHLGVGNEHLGPHPQRPQGTTRFGFRRMLDGSVLVPPSSSAKGKVTVGDIRAIRNALREAGFLLEGRLHRIGAWPSLDQFGNPVGDVVSYNLVTGSPIELPP
jgi:hypothetical protein